MIDLRIPRTGQYHKIVIIRVVSFHLKQVRGIRVQKSTRYKLKVLIHSLENPLKNWAHHFRNYCKWSREHGKYRSVELYEIIKRVFGNIRKEWWLILLSIHKISYSCNKIVIKLQIGSNRPLMLDLVKMVFWLILLLVIFFLQRIEKLAHCRQV